ncbi:MAG: hypothetical protein HQ528_05175 [Candidatus Marinimicrobia bacterium]|nr:hypothetical protein [Candidatus Neomarinimicrobiota bacterium]
MRKTTQMKAKLLLLSCFIVISSTQIFGSRPTVHLSTTALTPRVSMLEEDESTYWNSVLTYSQNFGSRLALESQFEVGSETGSLANPFRVYNLAARLNLGAHKVRLGRLAHWSSLSFGRVDGLDYTLKTTKAGSFKFIGGFNAVTDFSDTSFTDNTFILTGWSAGSMGNNLDLAYWLENDSEQSNSYVGVSGTKKLFMSIRLNGRLAWSISEGQVYHSRLRLSKSINKHTISIGFRQKRFLTGNPYPWVDDKVFSAPVFNLGLTSRLYQNLIWMNQLNYRLAEENIFYLHSSVTMKDISLALLVSSQGDERILGANIGAQKMLTKSLTLGGNVSANSVSYGDIIEPQKSTGLYYWLNWKPGATVSMRFFGRYYQNPYYKSDGRGGLVINVAL